MAALLDAADQSRDGHVGKIEQRDLGNFLLGHLFRPCRYFALLAINFYSPPIRLCS
jgi:hypothetical protein